MYAKIILRFPSTTRLPKEKAGGIGLPVFLVFSFTHRLLYLHLNRQALLVPNHGSLGPITSAYGAGSTEEKILENLIRTHKGCIGLK